MDDDHYLSSEAIHLDTNYLGPHPIPSDVIWVFHWLMLVLRLNPAANLVGTLSLLETIGKSIPTTSAVIAPTPTGLAAGLLHPVHCASSPGDS